MLPAQEIKKSLNQAPIVIHEPVISQAEIALFRQGTQTQYAETLPPTFATKYRHGEFEWLKNFGVSVREVLHADQEYEYLAPLKEGDLPVVSTFFVGFKERKVGAGSMSIFIFETDVVANDESKVKVKTTFVVREGIEA